MVWTALDDTEKKMLALEQGFFKYVGVKDTQIREICFMSATTYYAKLHALVETERAQRYDPITCRRVMDMREKRRQVRSADRMPSN